VGTQFNSRLTRSDSANILEGIVAVTAKFRPRARGTPAAKRGREATPPPARVERALVLSAPQERALGDTAAAHVLTVAEKHHFSSELETSQAFVAALNWLKRLHAVAKFDPKQFIPLYRLDKAPNPTKELSDQLRDEIKKEEGAIPDPFRESVSIAGRAVLAHLMIKQLASQAGESAAQQIQRRLQATDFRDVVNTYVEQFVTNTILKLLHRADPARGEAAIQEALQPVEKAAARAAKRAVARIRKEGKLTDSNEIRKIVTDELRSVRETNPVPMPG